MKKFLLILLIFALYLIFGANFSIALFFDFEDKAQLKEWSILSGTWIIVDDEITKSKVVRGEGANEIFLSIGNESWTDYTVEFDGCGITDDIGVAFRVKDANNFYAFLIAPNLNFSEWFSKIGGNFDENLGKKNDNLGISINEWHKYRLEVKGMEARIYVNGKEPFDAVEIGKGFEKGGIGFRQWGDVGHYDNILISGPGIPLSSGEKAVELKDKIASKWGIIKNNR